MLRLLPIIGALVLLASGFSSTTIAAQGDDTFVGRVDGTDGFIAVVTDGTGALAYYCDGVSNSDWFAAGDVRDGKAELRAPSGAVLMLQISESGVSGSLQRADGPARSFTAELATDDAGLYRGEFEFGGVTYVAGQIILPDGDFRGLAYGSDGLAFVPARFNTASLGPTSNVRQAFTSNIRRGGDVIQFEAERTQFGVDRTNRD